MNGFADPCSPDLNPHDWVQAVVFKRRDGTWCYSTRLARLQACGRRLPWLVEVVTRDDADARVCHIEQRPREWRRRAVTP